MTIEKVEQYRRKAEDCLQNAAGVSQPSVKAMWLGMAQRCLQLAESFATESAQTSLSEAREDRSTNA